MKLTRTWNRIFCALFLFCLILSGIVFEQCALAGSIEESEVASEWHRISNTSSIIHLSLAEKQFFSGSRVTGSAYLGVAYEEVAYEDNQDVPNLMKAEMLPLVTAGLKVKF